MEMLLRAGLSNAVAATLMALIVACLSRPLARRPAIRHGLWVLVLLKLITPPFYEVPIPWPLGWADGSGPSPVFMTGDGPTVVEIVTSGGGPDESSGVGAEFLLRDCDARVDAGALSNSPGPQGAGPVSAVASEVYRWVGVAWLAGTSAVLLLSVRRIRRFHDLLGSARKASWIEQEWIDEWAGRLGLRRGPDLVWVPGCISPMIWCGGFRPRLLLPEELWKRLDTSQRSSLVTHELAHLRRGDHLVRLLELLVTALFWWHPLVWWMRGPLREAEEQCCDAWVVWALPEAVRAYAETLLDTLEFLQKSDRPEPLLASGLGKVPDLRRRLTMIMTGSSLRLTGLSGKLGLLVVAGAMLPAGASWAQKAEEPKRAVVKVLTDDGELAADDLKIALSPVIETVNIVGEDSPGETPTQLETVQVSGSREDVIKKLEALIDDLKSDPKGEASQPRIKALKEVIGTIQKASGGRVIIGIGSDDEKEGGAHIRTVDRMKLDVPAGARSADVEKTRQEIARLKVDLKATMGRLVQAQAKLRELGEDPGEQPVVQWRVAPKKPQVELRIVKKVQDKNVSKPVDVDRKIELRRVETKTESRNPTDAERLLSLEKRLKGLQAEVDRLKQGSGRRGDQ
jgi:beta-lactamase regulating signal transducer with metallopeptidase domain